jgi:surface polysaccharide O-acyltransferase-like enzyme
MFILATTVQCGGYNVPVPIINIVHTIVELIKIGVPILLVIFGMLDLGKAVMAQKEDEIKKGQQTFIKRLIAAAIVFFVIVIVQLVFNLASGGDEANIWSCVEKFVVTGA